MKGSAICGYQLSEEEKLLLRYWLPAHIPFVFEKDLKSASRGMVCFPESDFSFACELKDYCLPVFIVAGSACNANELMNRCYNEGFAALYILPVNKSQLHLPSIELPEKKIPAFIAFDDERKRNFFRQLLTFAGFVVGSDFTSSNEIVEILREQTIRLFICDLDSNRIDHRIFFHKMRNLKKEVRHLKLPYMMFTKDFSIRGAADLSKLFDDIKPFSRRIMHEEEVILSILESFFLNDIKPLPLLKKRSLQEILASDTLLSQGVLRSLLEQSPQEHIHKFLWLLSFLDGGRGALLKPDIDFLNM